MHISHKFHFHRLGITAVLDGANAAQSRLESAQLRSQLNRGTAVSHHRPNILTPETSRKTGSTNSTMKTRVPVLSSITHSANGTITKGLKIETWKAVLAELNTTIDALNESTNKLADQAALNASLNSDVSTKANLLKELSERNMQNQKVISDHVATIEEHKLENERLNKANEKLKALLQEAHQALKDGGKHCASEQDDAIKKHLADYIKDYSFRTTKFARGDKLARLTKEIYEGLGAMLGFLDPTLPSHMPEDEFSRIYTSVVTSELNRRRQYVQTQMLGAFSSKSNRGCCMRLLTQRKLPLAVFLIVWRTTCCGFLPSAHTQESSRSVLFFML